MSLDQHMMGYYDLAAAASEEAVENVRSIERVPVHVLPLGGSRDLLTRMAALGHDVYCYKAAGGVDGPWNVWWDDTRLTVAEFVARFEHSAPPRLASAPPALSATTEELSDDERFPARFRDYRRERLDHPA